MGKELPTKHTSKKVKVAGVQNYINADTGEIVPMAVNEIEERDFNFSKIWMHNFIATLDLVGNKKTKLSYWIIENLDKENKLCLSYRQISDETGLSLDTVRVTMKTLLDADFMRKIGTAYQVNPDIIFKGSRNARLAVLNDYHAEPKRILTKDEKIKQLKESISTLQHQLNELVEDDNVIDAEVESQLSFTDDGQIVQRANEVKKKRDPSKSQIADKSDPFYSKENTKRLKKNAEEMDKIGGTIHEVN